MYVWQTMDQNPDIFVTKVACKWFIAHKRGPLGLSIDPIPA